MKKIKWTDLIIFIVTAELVGAVSSLLSGQHKDVLAGLNQPPLSPPAIVFPIVWAILYAAMGIGAYLIYVSEDSGIRTFSLRIYTIQLVVNFVWSIIFFRFELLGFSAVTAVILAALVAVMVWAFYKTRPLAAAINLPYLAWCIFAAYLAIGNAVLN